MIDQAERDGIISESAGWFSSDYTGVTSKHDLYRGKSPEYGGGIALFAFLNAETLKKLVERGYANPENRQDSAPTTGQFLLFLQSFPEFRANGYVVAADRDDCRISLTGLSLEGVHDDTQECEFRKFSRGATEVEVKPDLLYCYW